MDSDKAAVWVTNWDTERNGSSLTTRDGTSYLLANAFMLAYDYGQPHIFSGYYYAGVDDGAPGATRTSVPDMTCPTDGIETAGTWHCAQRWTAIRGMIGFRNAVAGTDVTDWKKYETNVLGFGRGSTGYLALNNSDADSTQTFTTSLPAGTYCNVYTTGDCSDTVTVAVAGTFTATVAKGSVVALYAGATPANWAGTRKYDPSDPAWFTGETPHKGDDTAAKSADSAASAKSGDAKSGKATSDAIRRAATLAAILLPVIVGVTFMAIARRNGKAQSDNSGPNND